ncbi:MAG: hypothetical protein ACHQ6U_02910 [Thermodesulfobacteriota bacterium]
MTVKEYYSFEETEELVNEFERVLNDNGIQIVPKSVLEALCLNIKSIYDKYKESEKIDPHLDIRPDFRNFIGLQDLMIKIVNSSENPSFKRLVPHLKKLIKSNPLQNAKTPSINQINNKMFELYIACLCLNQGIEEIYIEDPDKSMGIHPDIIARINEKLWGFACKSINSSKPTSICPNIKKAVDQIERSISITGIPIVNIKNITDHEDFWPIINQKEYKNGAEPEFGAFNKKDHPISMMKNYVDSLNQDLVQECNLRELKKYL